MRRHRAIQREEGAVPKLQQNKAHRTSNGRTNKDCTYLSKPWINTKHTTILVTSVLISVSVLHWALYTTFIKTTLKTSRNQHLCVVALSRDPSYSSFGSSGDELWAM
jgi:hypothetical protein